tara:strand:- start:793 stop:1272 length:480 start_codon:yes stop_codon:yes gene_type:complete
MDVEDWLIQISEDRSLARAEYEKYKKLENFSISVTILLFFGGVVLGSFLLVPLLATFLAVGTSFLFYWYFSSQSSAAFSRLRDGRTVLALFPKLNSLEECSAEEAFALSIGLARAFGETFRGPQTPSFEGMTNKNIKYLQAIGCGYYVDQYNEIMTKNL